MISFTQRNEVMSGSKRGGQLYKLMSSGERVPNEIIDDLLAEAMVKRVEKGANVSQFQMLKSCNIMIILHDFQYLFP